MAKSKSKQEVIDFGKWYEAVGCDLGALKGKDYVSVCPECDKKKWHVCKTTGQHHCYVCNFKGNHYTFMEWMQSQGSESGIEEIAAERGISVPTLQRAELFKYEEEWWLPVLNDDKLVTLRKWSPPSGEKGTKSYKAGILFNLPRVALEGTFLFQCATSKKSNKVILCEGPWDALALYDSLKLSDPTKLEFSIWAVPSANILRPRWYPKFSNKVIMLAFDNDKPGTDGMQLAHDALKEHCLSVKMIRWPEGTAEKYDLRDMCIEKKEETAKTLLTYFEHHQPAPERPSRMKYTEILADMRRLGVKTNQQFLDVFDCIVATAYVSHMTGDPLWMYVVGPPGSGKTLLTNSLFHTEHCHHVSKVTAAQLVSGKNDSDGNDPSLIPQLDNRCLVMKDYTEIIDMGGGAQAEMLSVLRGAYDRTLIRQYASGVGVRRYNSKFSIIAGVTGKIYQTTQAALGERFLRIHLDPIGGKDCSDQISSAMQASQSNPDMGMVLAPYVSAYLDYLKDTVESPPNLTKVQQTQIIPIVRVVAYLREATAVGREREDREAPPEIETGTRTANQLQKLAGGLCVVRQKTQVDASVFTTIRRVARDTCKGYYQDIVNMCHKSPNGLSAQTLAHRSKLALSPIRRKLNVLKQLEVLNSASTKRTDHKGRPEEVWQLHPEFAKIWVKSGIGV